MKCPYCAHLGDKVVDSRESKEGEAIRRRRECLECGKRFTSYERIDEIPYMVVKKDGTRERFDRQKLVQGLLKACEKRPVSVAAVEGIADRVEATLQDRPEKEIATADIGTFVMEELRKLDKVVDSRESKEGEVIRRRRECLECGKRFTSYERIDEIPYMVVKKDGSRERFERQKLVAGLLKACEKRPVSMSALEAVADRVEASLQERPEKEIAAAEIGGFVMEELKKLDKVAYVRFASVYRQFRDIGEFMNELKDLLNPKD